MDRQIVYAGSIPLDTDLLNVQRNVMTSMAALARAVIGDTGLVDGMPCRPGGADYTVQVGPGSYFAPFAVDSTAFGSLAADATPIVRTALKPETTVLQLGGPAGGNQVICWLIQVAITEVDAGPVALPYWNAAAPTVPFSGPGNSGQAQNTQRHLRAVVSAKPSGPEPFPVGVPPAADAGWIGLYSVTTFSGKSQIDPADIRPIGTAPMLRWALPQLPPGASAQEVFIVPAAWQAPPRVRQVRVRLVGGGGGGGGGDSGYSGGGGGAGGYAEAFVPVNPGQLYDVVIGASGPPGVAGASGSNGGPTSFAGLVIATGGVGGGAGNPNSAGGMPGLGTNGSFLQFGGYGGDGAPLSGVPGGNGGASAFGGGGRGAAQGGLPADGKAGGSGGGGGYGPQSPGGGGAGGLVILDY